jgi:hypothetical protein
MPHWLSPARWPVRPYARRAVGSSTSPSAAAASGQRIGLVHQFDEVFGVKIPLPSLQHGWLHGRELTDAWDSDRIFAAIRPRCWFSHFARDREDTDLDDPAMRLVAVAGYWPAGGFVELINRNGNPLDEWPRGTLAVYTDSAARSESLMEDMKTNYRRKEDSPDRRPRVGILSSSYGSLSVERVPITSSQTINRADLDLYYGVGAESWLQTWTALLQSRRYGLTILTGPPGTGKTSLLRSVAQWLVDSHVFYFMPAAKFGQVESGEVVSFWAGENRTSRRRKVLILEDAESLLMLRGEDNREKVATLLNLTDGMLGDLLGVQVVCTVNCDLTVLEPALLRPGRLLTHRAFAPLTGEQAVLLARLLGVPVPRPGPLTLAEFFNGPAEPRPIPAAARRRVLGFHASEQN